MAYKKHISLTKVYYGSFLLLIVIPILLVFVVSIGILGVLMREASVSSIQSAQGSMLEMLKEDVREASIQLSHFVYVNDGEYMELAADTDSNDNGVRNRNVKKLEAAFQAAMAPKQDILFSQFYMKSGRVISIKDEVKLQEEEIKSSAWYQQALEKKNVVSVGTYDTSLLSLTYSGQRKWEFIIAAALAPDELLDRSGKVELVSLFYRSGIGDLIRDYERTGSVGTTVILDKENEMIYRGFSGDEAAWYLEQLDTREAGTYDLRVKKYGDRGLGSVRYTYVVSVLPATGWKVVSFLPTGKLTEEFNRIVGVMLAVILVLFLLFYGFSRYFLRNILTPVHRVVEGMGQVQEGNLDVHIDPAGQSEIRKMIHSFNQMVRTLKVSIEEKETAQEKKHEAEIKALQSQINPHFLVNTLNSIRFMAQVSKFEGIRKMAEALIRIVSCSFRSNISFYSLGEELEVLDSYLYLMKIRYSDGFETEYEIQPETLECRVPRLLLQPLVENSIVHGFTGEEMGLLKISAARKENMLILSVWDNGQGMTEEEIRQIFQGKERKQNDNTSIGLENVISRLKLNFGEACTVQIDSEPERYTRITLGLPALEGEEKDEKSTDC
ncbi:MAG: sensor histidine kinase [Candidatus Limivivens sp.]|nr:sensor histidine kinase [Candidatus Limivivens sp.]